MTDRPIGHILRAPRQLHNLIFNGASFNEYSRFETNERSDAHVFGPELADLMVIIECPNLKIENRPALIAGWGSCRTYQPIQSVINNREINLIDWQITPFMYSAGEAAQYLDFCLGRRDISTDLRDLIFSDLRPIEQPAILRDRLLAVDLCIVEISTLDQLFCAGHYLNWNETGQYAIRSNIPAYMRWWSNLTNREIRSGCGQTVDEIIALRRSSANDISAGELCLLSETRFETLDAEGLYEFLSRMMSALPGKKWLFVSHLNVASIGPKMLPHRKQMLNLLETIAGDLGQSVFDPTPTVENFGYQRALESDGNDTHHYTAEFKPILGGALYERVSHILVK